MSIKRFFSWIVSFFIIAASLSFAGCSQASQNAPAAGAEGKGGSALTVRMLDIGQGDSLLLEKDGKWVFIDTGDVDHRPQLKECLKKYGIKEVSKVIITHPHADHIGGMYALFQSVKIHDIYDNGVPTTTNTYRTYLKQIKEKKIAYHKVKAGDTVALFDGVDFKVVAPVKTINDGKTGKPDMNNNSIVGRLSYGNFSMLFTGDAEKEEEKDILDSRANIKSTVLKVGHHGSKTSSTIPFLKAVSPELALISAGAGNSYGLPKAITLDHLKELHIPYLRTDQQGTITITTTGSGKYDVKKEK